jgi:superoxide reductase
MVQQVVDLLNQVNRVADRVNMTDLEKKHEPVIFCPEAVTAGEPFECTVHVGKHMPHPNEPDHHIEFIDLYHGEIFLCRADLQARKSEPTIMFTIMLQQPGELRAYASCNIHGVWAAEKEITVT